MAWKKTESSMAWKKTESSMAWKKTESSMAWKKTESSMAWKNERKRLTLQVKVEIREYYLLCVNYAQASRNVCVNETVVPTRKPEKRSQ